MTGPLPVAHRIGIVGASGYSGAELLRLLTAHPAVEVAVVAAHSQAGQPIASAFPNLPGQRRFDAVDVDRLAELDLVFLATPHGPSLDLGARLVAAGTPVIDLSGAYRLDPDGFATWYGEPHPAPELAPSSDGDAPGRAVYGLTEWHREAIAAARLVANPGCYPTAALLALKPLAPYVVPGSVVIAAMSGTSGAGRATGDHLHFSHVHGDVTAYGAPSHRHTGEIERYADLGPISFTPHLVPMSRGLLATVHGAVTDGVGPDDVHEALTAAYTDEPFVTVLPAGTFPHTKAVAGSNAAQVSAVLDPRTSRVVATCAIDNLGKGAAGQALQNANLVLGLDETMGLSATGIYP